MANDQRRRNSGYPMTRSGREKASGIWVLGIGIWLAAAGPVQAQTNLRLELAELAKQLKEVLRDQGEEKLAIGPFVGPCHIPSSANPAIVQVLSEELQKVGIAIHRRANLEIKGDYIDVTDQQTKLLAVKLSTRVLDRKGQVVATFDRGIFGDATIPALLGLTVQYPPKGDVKTRNRQLEQGIDAPRTYLTQSRLAAAPDSPYAIEVLVKAPDGTFQPRAPKDEEGLAFLPIRKEDEVFAVRLINDSAYEAAALLTIDGLNVFAFGKNKT